MRRLQHCKAMRSPSGSRRRIAHRPARSGLRLHHQAPHRVLHPAQPFGRQLRSSVLAVAVSPAVASKLREAATGQIHAGPGPNNSSEPTQLRSGFAVAGKACHCKTSTAPRGSTQVLGPVPQVQGVVPTLSPACAVQIPSGLVAATSLPHVLSAFGHSGGFGIRSRTSRCKPFGRPDLSAVLACAVSPAVASRLVLALAPAASRQGTGPNNSSKPTPLRGAA